MNNKPGHLIDSLLEQLKSLSTILCKKEGINTVDAYDYFINHSNKKENCAYAKKTKKRFIEEDYEEIRDKIISINRILEQLEIK